MIRLVMQGSNERPLAVGIAEPLELLFIEDLTRSEAARRLDNKDYSNPFG